MSSQGTNSDTRRGRAADAEAWGMNRPCPSIVPCYPIQRPLAPTGRSISSSFAACTCPLASV
ncbi:uncharacterized protein B0I36DRAFT_322360 [Microdochium trichocladiopsis]|uniref:Uncharacterized protein n=1 Tax=Microdochium trichocladiopsis TaxID=1682393 RepID=A0A9P8Y6R9_9PEZI|nr:uncharacterized protein B0I36DRAFT_322360 [Microdochium trichocladiopsis]KAH7030743.1 hypothetical protein B0I36DRAFT_322360 [Microdochium trichocladiopsis]